MLLTLTKKVLKKPHACAAGFSILETTTQYQFLLRFTHFNVNGLLSILHELKIYPLPSTRYNLESAIQEGGAMHFESEAWIYGFIGQSDNGKPHVAPSYYLPLSIYINSFLGTLRTMLSFKISLNRYFFLY